ncbi:MAG: hypothetical protein RL173_2440 [Fibrobacterota bacterium]
MRWSLAILLPSLIWAAAPTTRRILVGTWAPTGPAGKPRLQHGAADARDLADAFQRLGSVGESDTVLLEVSDTTALVRAWDEATTRSEKARSQGLSAELIVFHTGHADAQGFRLGDQVLPWSRVQQFLSKRDGSMKVAFLDACASGNALRSKGGKFVSSAATESVAGSAVLSSSRSNELSTESDKDGGSLFTRAVVAGLRGAADSDHDGRVTLSETFRYAAVETERRASALGAPEQHPSGSTELVGEVDPVLTDLRSAPARLRFEAGFPATSLWDSTRRVIGTASTGPRDSLELALSPGLWTLRTDSGSARMQVLLREGESRRISPLEMVTIPVVPRPADTTDTTTRWVPINFGILPPVSINGAKPRRVKNAFSMDFILGEAKTVSGFQFSGVMSRVFGDASGLQMSVAGNTVLGNMSGFQFSNANQVDGNLVGAQLATYLNMTEGDLRGAQVSALMNVARGNVEGAQLGGAAYAGNLRHGAQIALVTVSGKAVGVQAGLVNVAREMDGLQLGLVNVGSGSGARLGFVNVVPSGKPISIGALSVGSQLELHPIVQISQDLSNRLLLRTRMDWFQSGLSWEGLPYLGGERILSIETSARLERLLATELGFAWVFPGWSPRLVPEIVAGFSLPLMSHLSPIVQARWSLETKRATLWSGVEF